MRLVATRAEPEPPLVLELHWEGAGGRLQHETAQVSVLRRERMLQGRTRVWLCPGPFDCGDPSKDLCPGQQQQQQEREGVRPLRCDGQRRAAAPTRVGGRPVGVGEQEAAVLQAGLRVRLPLALRKWHWHNCTGSGSGSACKLEVV